MGASAQSKLDRAKELHKQAVAIRKWDPDGASQLDSAAMRQNRAAAKQLRGRRKRGGSNRRTL